MEIDEIIRRLERIAPYGTHYPGEPLFVLSLDDGIALKEAIELLKKQDTVEHALDVLRAHGWKDETEVTGDD